ncbi:MAG: proteasome subunit beta [Actinomycetota bacterium]|nr:proteasome subunit beta [Actinomycetota bacterium]
MTDGRWGSLRGAASGLVPAGFIDPFDAAGSSFSALLQRTAPQALQSASESTAVAHVEGTTIVALTFESGVVIAGDRRATSGNVISKRDMRKVFEADSWSAVGISGAAGPAMELAKVFATELEHYEKVEGGPLSLEGKANKLGQMVRANLPMAMQGLVVVPLFAGYDPREQVARIYEFDAAGGRFEERRFATSGSGGRDARGSLKARYREDLDRDAAVNVGLEALWDAADEDAATGGPDLVRGIYPLVAVVDADGYRELTDEVVSERVSSVIADRRR